MQAIGDREVVTGGITRPNHPVEVGEMGRVVELLVGTQREVHGVIGMRELLEGLGELEVQG